MGKTLYDILDISPDASVKMLEATYHRLRHDFPCTENPDSETVLKVNAIHEAYRILSDPMQRALYDQKIFAQEQSNYEAAALWEKNNMNKWLIALVLVIACGFGLYNYKLAEKKQARELAEMKRQEDLAAIKQEELKLEAEQAKLETERLQNERNAARDRERLQQQFRSESRQFAADQDRQEREKRRLEQERLAQQRMEQDRNRREASSVRSSVIYAR